jgi:hypothetical protein
MPTVSGVRNIMMYVRSGRTASEVRGRTGVGGRSIYGENVESEDVTKGQNKKYVRWLV